jgi:hypothetical protein
MHILDVGRGPTDNIDRRIKVVPEIRIRGFRLSDPEEGVVLFFVKIFN